MADPVHDEWTLRSISRASLAAYLTTHDWRHADDWPEAASVYVKTVDGRERRIWVPLRETFADYAVNMERSIELLADLERRPPMDVLFDLRTTTADVVSIDAANNGVSGALSIRVAEDLMGLSSSMITAAARSTEKPRAAYLGSVTNEVAGFVAAVTPAPMDFSSFGLRLLLPERSEYGQTGLWSGEPFSRKVARNLARGLAAVEHALSATSESETRERLDQGIDIGVSANLCGALAGLAVQAQDFSGAFRVSLNWAHLRPPPDPTPVSFPFSFHAADRLGEAGRYLRTRASFLDERITADVVLLEREPSDPVGRVRLLVDFEGHVQRIETELGTDDYTMAIEAHKRGAQIEVDGDLFPAGRGYELRNPRNLRMISVA